MFHASNSSNLIVQYVDFRNTLKNYGNQKITLNYQRYELEEFVKKKERVKDPSLSPSLVPKHGVRLLSFHVT